MMNDEFGQEAFLIHHSCFIVSGQRY